ncbi:T9SS type A sorting domain-containing protein [uncultured Polaribacter sp.]|uniref:T9SS type A sorting domain-containing protein n=1 Tax=uncultured Polaribacter sp. TaxID=174711 RepID=UPI002635D8D0|nr:T9SS type A sorting domain-containing protein [uncultured Polaribacter sp.]
MIKKQHFLLYICCCFFWAHSLKAQDPNWSVNPSDFQFNMTFTAFLNVDGIVLNNTTDKVAAFVDGQIRGTANLTYVAASDKYVAYLTAYANTNNETLTFKIYNSNTSTIVDAVNTTDFQINAQKGSLFQSYGISNTYLNEFINIVDFNFKGVTPQLITNSDTTFDFILPPGTSITNLTPTFTTSNNEKVFYRKERQVSGVSEIDFSEPVTYTVLSESESVLKEYRINVFVIDENFTTSVALNTTRAQHISSLPVKASVAFSKPITDFTEEDFKVDNAIVIDLEKIDNQNYIVTVIPLVEGDFSFQLKRGSVLDANNKTNLQSNSLFFYFDKKQPILKEVYAGINAIHSFFEIVFSEEVINVDATDFVLTGRDTSKFKIEMVTFIGPERVLIDVVPLVDSQQTPIFFIELSSDTDITDLAQNKVINQKIQSYFIDSEPPVLSVNDFIILNLNTDGVANLTIDLVDTGSFDTYNLSSLSLSKTLFTEADLGENQIIFKATDQAGNVSEMTIIVLVTNDTLSNEDVILEKMLSIFPNPVGDKLFVSMDASIEIKSISLFSIDGKKLFSENSIPNFINTTVLSKGIYFLKVQTDNVSFTKKIIKH